MRSLLNDRTTRRRLPIGMTPLIDVVFILLIFLMLASRFADYGALSLSLPSGAASGQTAEPPIRIRLLRNGEIVIDGAASTLDRLAGAIRQRDGHERRRILIVPEPAVPVQRVVHVLDRLSIAGIRGAVLASDERTAR